MNGLTRYPVWGWLLTENEAEIKRLKLRAKYAGGTLIDVFKAADVEAVLEGLRGGLEQIAQRASDGSFSQLEATRLLARLEREG